MGGVLSDAMASNTRMDGNMTSIDSNDRDVLKDDLVVSAEARDATEMEHNMGFMEALKTYPTAIGWSVFFSLGIIMTAVGCL